MDPKLTGILTQQMPSMVVLTTHQSSGSATYEYASVDSLLGGAWVTTVMRAILWRHDDASQSTNIGCSPADITHNMVAATMTWKIESQA